jgi:hypothetical protein
MFTVTLTIQNLAADSAEDAANVFRSIMVEDAAWIPLTFDVLNEHTNETELVSTAPE